MNSWVLGIDINITIMMNIDDASGAVTACLRAVYEAILYSTGYEKILHGFCFIVSTTDTRRILFMLSHVFYPTPQALFFI